jgi:diguanylate cyclase (GGDEF)-like protein
VVEGNKLVGMIDSDRLLAGDESRLVSDLMDTDVPTVTPDVDADEAAKLMVRTRVHRLPVLERGKLVGVITSTDLLPEITRSFDPLTELPWSDGLRDWAIERLQNSQEITVLFVDLDKFGRFNKKYGHLVGDEVLRAVTQTLLDVTEAPLDFVSKYGGDEFCIGTLRSAEEAAELGEKVQEAVSQMSVEGHAEEEITCTIGQAGGKRSHERLHVHYAATMNSLIDLASKNCMEKKAAALAEAGDGEPERESRPRLISVDVARKGRKTTVTVDLQCPSMDLSPVIATRDADEEEVLSLVAQATVDAVRPLFAEDCNLVIGEVQRLQTSAGQTYVCVIANYTSPAYTTTVAGSAIASADLYRAAAAAVLDCVNRLIGR